MRHKESVSHQQGADVQAHDAQASCDCERVRGTAATTRGDTDATKPRAAETGGSQAAVACGTARQQVLAGAPAAAPLHALRSGDESSLDEAESTPDEMSDGEDAR